MWAQRPQAYAHSCTFMFMFMIYNRQIQHARSGVFPRGQLRPLTKGRGPDVPQIFGTTQNWSWVWSIHGLGLRI